MQQTEPRSNDTVCNPVNPANGWMEGQTDGWIDGRTDERMDR